MSLWIKGIGTPTDVDDAVSKVYVDGLEGPMDLLTEVAKAADPRHEPMPGDKVRVGRDVRYVVERKKRDLPGCQTGDHFPEHCVELLYLVTHSDKGFDPTHHSCPLLQWRIWARNGVEVK